MKQCKTCLRTLDVTAMCPKRSNVCRKCDSKRRTAQGHETKKQRRLDKLCIRCGKQPAVSGATRCTRHLEEDARYQRKRKYGVDEAAFQLLMVKQNGGCAICKSTDPGKQNTNYCTDTKKRFSVDHDHVTGQVRGLLCDSCNRGIGLMQDDPELLLNAFRYLMEAKRRNELLSTSSLLFAISEHTGK